MGTTTNRDALQDSWEHSWWVCQISCSCLNTQPLAWTTGFRGVTPVILIQLEVFILTRFIQVDSYVLVILMFSYACLYVISKEFVKSMLSLNQFSVDYVHLHDCIHVGGQISSPYPLYVDLSSIQGGVFQERDVVTPRIWITGQVA